MGDYGPLVGSYLAGAERVLDRSESIIDGLADVARRLAGEVDRLTAELAEARAAYSRMEVERDSIRTQFHDAAERADMYREQRGEAMAASEPLRDANADLTDRLDRTLAELREVVGERDEALEEAKATRTAATPHIKALEGELAAANTALADVTDLLDEARTERDAARAELDELRQAIRLVPLPITDAELEASDWDRDDAIQTRRADR
jgi:chromosome segregation ATPase